MTRKQRRLVLLGSSLGGLALAADLVVSALKDSIVFFNSPTDVVEKHVQPGSRIRLGGLVKEGTVQRGDRDHQIQDNLHHFHRSSNQTMTDVPLSPIGG